MALASDMQPAAGEYRPSFALSWQIWGAIFGSYMVVVFLLWLSTWVCVNGGGKVARVDGRLVSIGD